MNANPTTAVNEFRHGTSGGSSNMVVTTSFTEERIALGDLGRNLVASAVEFADLETPSAVLDDLDGLTFPDLDLRVLVAIRFPLNASDWSSLALGKTVFLHSEAPKSWWEEWSTKLHYQFPIAYLMARTAMVPHTMTESLRALQPIGADRWGYDLFLRHGMRDGLLCPVTGRWLVVFWSTKPLSKAAAPAMRVAIFAGRALPPCASSNWSARLPAVSMPRHT